MTGKGSRDKGARGEREFCLWLYDNLQLETVPARNLEQVRRGGADIIDVEPFAVEVKRQERVCRKKWWSQICSTDDVIYEGRIVVVKDIDETDQQEIGLLMAGGGNG